MSPSELCEIVVYTDGGAAFRPGEGAVASWGFVAVLMCGNEAVCVISCASRQVEQNRIDDSMRLEIRFDSKYAAAVAVGTQRCSSNTELVHKLRHQRRSVE